MQKRILVMILLSMLCSLSFGDSIYGRIIDEKRLTGVSEAMIWLDGEDVKTISDADGKFELKGLQTGKYLLKVRHQGFKDLMQNVEVPQMGVLVIQLEKKSLSISGVSVTGTRAELRKTPVAVTNISQGDIRSKLQGQDLPMILDDVPGLMSYSESGSGSGYSYLKARGFDQKRIGVMINGIPLNDPEDHSVYWVNMPDFAESVQDIQFQHGVGVSKYGIASFGGSLNIQTISAQNENLDEIVMQTGSYNTQKYGLKYNSNLSDNIELNIRMSQITSDGYRDNSASELTALYSSLYLKGKNSMTEINYYTGHEITHAAWDASYEGDLAENHQNNPISYDNTVDDFSQPHFELHNYYSINDNAQLKNSFFYIRGKGNYEQLKYGRYLWEYGLAAEGDIVSSDLIRQKWVEKNQYGWITSYSVSHNLGEFSCGTYLSHFNSDHWGEVDELKSIEIPAGFESDFEYYRYQGEKNYITAYMNESFQPIEDLNLQANLHYQYITYNFAQKEAGNFEGEYLNNYEVDYSFLNPQLGVNYNLTRYLNVFGSAAIAHREPADDELFDIWDGPDDLGKTPLFEESEAEYDDEGNITGYKWTKPQVEAEYVIDYEAGFGFVSNLLKCRVNGYYMDFKNEIVDYGGVKDDDAVRGNADATVHRGVEAQLSYLLPANLKFSGNIAWSDNYFNDFTYSDYYENEIDLSGNQLGGFPRFTDQVKLQWNPGFISLFAQAKYIGEQYLDNTENKDHVVDAYTVCDMGLDFSYSQLIGNTTLEFQFRLFNMMDLEYETAGYLDDYDGDWEYDDNFYYPAAGRNFTAAIRLLF